MNIIKALPALIALAIPGCAHVRQAEVPRLMPPVESEIVGTYAIIEETVSGQTLAESGVTSARLEIRKDGAARFVDFPLFNAIAGGQRFPKKITEDGRWTIAARRNAYELLLISATVPGFGATIVEGGRPIDLIIYYGSSDPVGFSKWRKM